VGVSIVPIGAVRAGPRPWPGRATRARPIPGPGYVDIGISGLGRQIADAAHVRVVTASASLRSVVLPAIRVLPGGAGWEHRRDSHRLLAQRQELRYPQAVRIPMAHEVPLGAARMSCSAGTRAKHRDGDMWAYGESMVGRLGEEVGTP
jgi:hypothetical protein